MVMTERDEDEIRVKLLAEAKVVGSRQMAIASNCRGTRIANAATSPPGKRDQPREIRVFDGALAEVSRFRLHRSVRVHDLAVSPSGRAIAAALQDGLALFDAKGELLKEWNHCGWGKWLLSGCAFSGDGRLLWAVAPGEAEGEGPSVQMIDCRQKRVIATSPLEIDASIECACRFVVHPAGEVVAVSALAGQDGQWNFFATSRNRAIDLVPQPKLDGLAICCFHPAGHEFLLTSSMEGLIQRRRFPNGRVIAQKRPKGRWYGHEPFYVSDKEAAVVSLDGLLIRFDLKKIAAIDEILPQGYVPPKPRWSYEEPDPFGQLIECRPLPGARLLTTHEKNKLKLWDARSLFPPSGVRRP